MPQTDTETGAAALSGAVCCREGSITAEDATNITVKHSNKPSFSVPPLKMLGRGRSGMYTSITCAPGLAPKGLAGLITGWVYIIVGCVTIMEPM